MRKLIPSPLIAVCAEIAAKRESHATLDNLFTYAGASGEPPEGSKPAKALAWLRQTNRDENIRQPIDVLGKILEQYMEEILDPDSDYDKEKINDREKVSRTLAEAELQYIKGGKVIGTLGTPSKTLEDYIRDRDIDSINMEFDRALTNVEQNPREAVSAASNILESLCKIYIEDEKLDKPNKLDLKNVWTIVRKDLGFDPSILEDKDLQAILTGLLSIVDGVGALRTHASSAHGAGKKIYKLEPRHARLAIHSAHTVALFTLESWNKKKLSSSSRNA
jgi:hypothetical protein